MALFSLNRDLPQLVAPDFKGQGNIVGKELTCTQTLRHRDMIAIGIGSKLGDGIQSDITFECRGNPRAISRAI